MKKMSHAYYLWKSEYNIINMILWYQVLYSDYKKRYLMKKDKITLLEGSK